MADLYDLSDLAVPDFQKITIAPGHTLDAYRNTGKCPAFVKGQIWAAKRTYNEITHMGETEPEFELDGVTPKLDTDGKPVMRDLYEPNDVAWYQMWSDMLAAAIPGLKEATREILAGDWERARDLLTGLGWWIMTDETAEDESGEAAGEAPIPSLSSSPA